MSAATITLSTEATAFTPDTTPIAIAALTQATKKYGAITALDSLSLNLYPGEIVALLGPNGAGKSTTVRLLLGLSAPSSGTARIFGGDPRMNASRTRIGAMLQVASIPKTLKVREHIEMFRGYYPNPLPFAEVVRIAQLEGIEDRLFEHLSGGQRQRVLFALAVCGDPEIVFLDEPTVGLDIESRHGLWAQIRSLAARGKTVLLTTHYLEEADALASRIVVVDKGHIVAEGTPKQIKSRTSTRRITCHTALTVEHLWSLPGVIDVQRSEISTTITAGNAESVLRHMLAADAALSNLEIVSPGLEEAFLALTARPN